MLSGRVKLIDYIGRICFHPTTHMRYLQEVWLHQEVIMSGKKSLVNQSSIFKRFNTYGSKIQNLKLGSVPIQLIQEKLTAKFVYIVQS